MKIYSRRIRRTARLTPDCVSLSHRAQARTHSNATAVSEKCNLASSMQAEGPEAQKDTTGHLTPGLASRQWRTGLLMPSMNSLNAYECTLVGEKLVKVRCSCTPHA